MMDNDELKTTPCPRCLYGTMYWQFVQGEPHYESCGYPDNYRGECEGCGLVKWAEQPSRREVKVFDSAKWQLLTKGTW
jgi:hypothetical protein